MSATNTGWRLILLESPSPSLTVESNPITLELVSPGPQGPSGSAAAVTSVNGQTGAVVLNAASVGAAASVHGHAISDVGGLQASLDGKAAAVHGHAIADVTGLQTALDGKAASSHTHSASQISDSSAVGRSVLTAADATSARAALSAAASSHGHAISDVSGLQTALDAKLDDSQASVTGLSILSAADAAAVRSTLGLATTDTPVFAAVEFANGERIRNSTNGRVEIVPQPTGASRHGIYFDMVAVGGQLNIGTVRSTDGALNIGKIVFDATIGVGTLDFAPGLIQETVGDLTLESIGGSVYLFGASVFINSYSIPGTIGTVGQVLTSNGTDGVWQTPASGGISEEDAIAFAAAL